MFMAILRTTPDQKEYTSEQDISVLCTTSDQKAHNSERVYGYTLHLVSPESVEM